MNFSLTFFNLHRKLSDTEMEKLKQKVKSPSFKFNVRIPSCHGSQGTGAGVVLES